MRVYKHYRPRAARAPLALFGVMGVGALVGLAWSASQGFDSEPPFPVFVLLLAVVGINLTLLGATAVEVRLEDGDNVEFVGPFRRARISVHDILSIKPSELTNGAIFVVRHLNGTVRLDPKLDGAHELITELKRRNGAIELRGI